MTRVKRFLRLVVPEGTYTYTSVPVALNVAVFLGDVASFRGRSGQPRPVDRL